MAKTDRLIQELVADLDDRKDSFLEKTRTNINSFISEKSTLQCLELVTRNSDGRIAAHWSPREGMAYAGRLIAFCRKKPHEGYVVDSALTDDVVKIVSDSLVEFYQENNEIIAKKLLEEIIQNDIARNAFLDGLLSTKFGRMATGTLESHLFQSITVALQSNATHFASALSQGTTPIIAKTTAIAAASPVAHAIIAKACMFLAAHLSMIIVKVMALPAVKAAAAALIKKFVVAAFVAYFAKVIVAKTGMSAGAVVGIILVPIIAGFLVYEWQVFPEKLGEGISDAVSQDLRSEFRETNMNILSHLFDHVKSSMAKDLGKALAGDPVVNDELDMLIRAFC